MEQAGIVHYFAPGIALVIVLGLLAALLKKVLQGWAGATVSAPFLLTVAVIVAFGTGSKFEAYYADEEFRLKVTELENKIATQDSQIATLEAAGPDGTKITALESQVTALQAKLTRLDPAEVEKKIAAYEAFLAKFTESVVVKTNGQLYTNDPQKVNDVLKGWENLGPMIPQQQ